MNNIKFANAEQTKVVYSYKNMKAKLYKTSVAIWFNKICKIFMVAPCISNIKYFV